MYKVLQSDFCLHVKDIPKTIMTLRRVLRFVFGYVIDLVS